MRGEWRRMRKQRLLFLCMSLLLVLGLAKEKKTALPADAPATLPKEENYIALTFDDGPRKGTTDRLLDGLKERGASATFFLVGEEIEGNEELVKRMQREGHQIGNHTWSHVRLEGASPAVITEEIQKTEIKL